MLQPQLLKIAEMIITLNDMLNKHNKIENKKSMTV